MGVQPRISWRVYIIATILQHLLLLFRGQSLQLIWWKNCRMQLAMNDLGLKFTEFLQSFNTKFYQQNSIYSLLYDFGVMLRDCAGAYTMRRREWKIKADCP